MICNQSWDEETLKDGMRDKNISNKSQHIFALINQVGMKTVGKKAKRKHTRNIQNKGINSI